MPSLPNHLRTNNYWRCGGVSRVAKGADCKSDHFALVINRHSEKDGKFGHNSINRLGRISERGSPRHGHAITRKRPQAREFFSAPSPLNIEDLLNHAPILSRAGPSQP
jgi:hypothetical protein